MSSLISRFSVIVARRVYRKIGHCILKQKNIENYDNAGKIYVPFYRKIIETFLSIFDFIKLLGETKTSPVVGFFGSDTSARRKDPGASR